MTENLINYQLIYGNVDLCNILYQVFLFFKEFMNGKMHTLMSIQHDIGTTKSQIRRKEQLSTLTYKLVYLILLILIANKYEIYYFRPQITSFSLFAHHLVSV